MPEQRPNPDQLLAQVHEEEARQKRGRLKIFFGMSAGVGKTYAMIEEARARAAEGSDVLVGYAEPHIRPETEALLLGLDILPYKMVEYRGAMLKEFDLDAALARRPAIVLVDELAHTNAPGLRHPKRWQDVMELLDTGISVYSTLNVQHLESVNDIVERITGIKVRETLPDSVLENADEVELVDIAPEELLERFAEGKIYRPEQAERASKHFFNRGNLLALRELALRTTAQRVDAQMQEGRDEPGARSAPAAASERVLVCVGPSPLSARLVRSARRLATGLKAPLIAAYVEKTRARTPSSSDAQRLEQTLRLAEQLGAQTVTLSGSNVAEELIAYAVAHRVTKIVVGKPQQPRWREWLMGSVVDDLIRRSGEIDIYVIRGRESEESSRPLAPGSLRRSLDVRGYAWAILLTAAVTAIGWPLYHHFGFASTNILMLYLLSVLWIATRYSRGAAILTSILSVAAFDFCFVPPYLAFSVSDRQYILTFIVMLTTALVITALTARVRLQVEAARQRDRRTAAGFALSRELAAARNVADITAAAIRHVHDLLPYRAVILLPDADRKLAPHINGTDADEQLKEKEFAVAQWSFDHERSAGRGTDTLSASAGTYLPLRAPRGTAGVLALFTDSATLLSDQRQLLDAFASQIAIALERAALADEARLAWERVEAEFLRNTLLSGVSHELRTPLAAIIGSASALNESINPVTPEIQKQLLQTITSESERMNRLINNLLDMTRLESGGLVLKREWQPIQEVIGSTLHHLTRRLGNRPVTNRIPADLPLVNIDGIAIEQVLTNLLDNAIEYTPPDSPLEINVLSDGKALTIEVADHGPGLSPGTELRVFEKFFRAARGEGRRGIGLGLAIASGIVAAHGGNITAANRPGGGAVFRFTLPLIGTPPSMENAEQHSC
ncbi:MAG TPA: sensor histidine kinase KdpD [Tepidisphaeraceae bacterium]|jgi:two-component system sensor histidine kinase KdpD